MTNTQRLARGFTTRARSAHVATARVATALVAITLVTPVTREARAQTTTPRAARPLPYVGVLGGNGTASIGHPTIGSPTGYDGPYDHDGTLRSAFGVVPFTRWLGARVEVGRTQKGFRYGQTSYNRLGPIGHSETNLRIDYTELSTLVQLGWPVLGGHLEPRAYGGPSVGFRRGCPEQQYDYQMVGADTACLAKSTDVGLTGGGELALTARGFGVVAGARVENGRRDIRGFHTYPYEEPIRNRFHTVYVGVQLPIPGLRR